MILNFLVYDLVHVTLQLIASQFVNLGVEPLWSSRPRIVSAMLNNAIIPTLGRPKFGNTFLSTAFDI